jgi:hypothetical protein
LIDRETGSRRVLSNNVLKMGSIQLRPDEENLYSAWEKSRISQIDDYMPQSMEIDFKKPSQVIESWICRPPNILFF